MQELFSMDCIFFSTIRFSLMVFDSTKDYGKKSTPPTDGADSHYDFTA